MAIHLIQNAQHIVDAIVRLHRDVTPINYRSRCVGPRQLGEFDPNAYLKALPHLQLVPGYVLDYFYYCDEDRMGCRPVVYVRRVDALPFEDSEEVFAYEKANPIQYFLITDDSPDGWFELSALLELEGQFYRFWHSNYGISRVLTSQQELDGLVSELDLDDDKREAARKLDGRVGVEIHLSCVDVTYCRYSGWRGISRVTESFQRKAPHVRLGEVKKLAEIPYDCGIRF